MLNFESDYDKTLSICQDRERAVRWFFCLFFYLILTVISCCAAVPTDYYNHVVFDNSITPDYYYYSSGRAVYPSTIDLLSGSLPVEKKNFFTPPNALRLKWRSVSGGSWETELRVVSMRNRPTDFRGDTLYPIGRRATRFYDSRKAGGRWRRSRQALVSSQTSVERI
jgi:hypothetical protein